MVDSSPNENSDLEIVPEPSVANRAARHLRPVRPATVTVLVTLLALAAVALGSQSLRDDDGPSGLTGDASPSVTPSVAASATIAPATSLDDSVLGPGWARILAVDVGLAEVAGGTGGVTLVPGEVVRVEEGLSVVDGVAWYRFAAIGGRSGWAPNGAPSEPAASMIDAGTTLFRCGRVRSTELVVLDDIAVPSSMLDDLALGTLELSEATGTEACLLLDAEPDGPRLYVDASVTACGEAHAYGSALRLVPTLRGQYSSTVRVKSDVGVRRALLTESAIRGPDGRTNRQNVLLLAAASNNPIACVHARVTESQDATRDAYFMADSIQCVAVVERTGDHLVLEPAAGSKAYRFDLTMGTSIDAHVAAGRTVAVNMTALYSDLDQEFFSLVALELPNCPATPTPRFDPGSVVETASDRLRVRSQPRVSDDSIMYEPVLPLGTKLFIRGGPVIDSGYVWYDVATVSFDPWMAGWVAAADKDGEPWLRLSSYEPEPSPTAPPEPSQTP